MKSYLLAVSMVLSMAAFAAVDPEKDIWFLADFDSPTLLGGHLYGQEMSQRGLVDGRFGKGYYFYRETNNQLPPMRDLFADEKNFVGKGLTLKPSSLVFKGGDFALSPRPARVSPHWIGHDAGITWSVYVKGASGTSVKLWSELSPVEEKKLAAVRKKNPNFDSDMQPDLVMTNTVVLSGVWQRVFCHAVCDNRTGGFRTISLKMRTSGPVEMERFQQQLTGVYPSKGRFEPGIWVDGGVTDKGTQILCSDFERLMGFPAKEGTCAFWIKNADNVPENAPVNVWSYTRPWSEDWSLGEGFPAANRKRVPAAVFRGGKGGSYVALNSHLPRRSTWTHVAFTWEDGRCAYYVNGTLVCERLSTSAKNQIRTVPQTDPGAIFRVGAVDATGPTDAIFDELAIFSRSLEEEEVEQLAKAKGGLLAGSSKLLAEPVFFRTFFRDQTDARLHFRVYSPSTAQYTLGLKVSGSAFPDRSVTLQKGVSFLDVPFDPAQFRPGRYPYSVLLKDGRQQVVLSFTGDLAILGRAGREPFLFHSWGGSSPVSNGFLKQLGVNARNINSGSWIEMRKALDDGLFANIRYENGAAWFTENFDWAAIRSKTIKDLEFAAALPNWRSALVNSEIYSTDRAKKAQSNPKYRALVEKATGLPAEFTYKDAPAEVDFKKLGQTRPKGVIDHKTCPTLETLNFVSGTGLPSILSNYETTKAIHSLKPDVTVWSEPMWGGVAASVDMGSDWEYRYSTRTTLSELRAHYAACRAYGKPYMPTLGGNYWPEIRGLHPTRRDANGKPEVVKMAQGADEVVIKTWLSLGAIPAGNLSWFAIDAWENGAANMKKFVDSPTNAVTSVAEIDCAARYGTAWRRDLAPAADLLRNMPNAQARVAYVKHLPEIAHAAGYWWGYANYGGHLGSVLSSHPVPFDYIGSRDILAGAAAKYDYVFIPMCSVLYREHDDALRAAVKCGTRIVLDKFATIHFDNEIVIDGLTYLPNQWRKMTNAFDAWYTNVVREVIAQAGAASPKTDGRTSFTFEKVYKGARYVTVVNDKRDDKPSAMNVFLTNNWYRVVGAPETIETEIRGVSKNAKVYLFNGQGRGRRVSRTGSQLMVTGEFGPAEGCVYCVYPQALKAPVLSLEGVAAHGRTTTLLVRIDDESGKPAPGRQVVLLRLADDKGIERDESGRYVVEDGCVRIPIRIARDEQPTGFLSRWKAEVTDLTTGKSESLRIEVK